MGLLRCLSRAKAPLEENPGLLFGSIANSPPEAYHSITGTPAALPCEPSSPCSSQFSSLFYLLEKGIFDSSGPVYGFPICRGHVAPRNAMTLFR